MEQRLFCTLLFLLLPQFLFCKQSSLDTYKSDECDSEKRCFFKILNLLESQTNEQFMSSRRTKAFKKIIEPLEKPGMIDFEDTFMVYSILDSYLVKEVLKKQKFKSTVSETASLKPIYSNEVFESLIKSFVYIGSDQYGEMRQPLYYAKSQCPEKETAYVNEYYSPASQYICISAWEPVEKISLSNSENVPSDIFLYPLIALTSQAAAKKIENALVYYLKDMLVNYEDVSNDNVSQPNADDHFLAHYALEYTLRFFSIGDGHSTYPHKDIPFFPMHPQGIFGSYYYPDIGHSNFPKLLNFQGKYVYKFQPTEAAVDQSIKSAKLPFPTMYIRLPFGEENSDYIMDEQANNLVVNLMNKYAVIFQTNAPSVYNCYEAKTKNFSVSTNKSLKTLVEALYTNLLSCATEDEPSSNVSKFNYALFQRVRAKFEFTLTAMLYMFNDTQYTLYQSEDKNTEKRHFPAETDLKNTLNELTNYIEEIGRDERQNFEADEDEDDLGGFEDVEVINLKDNNIEEEDEEEKEEEDNDEYNKYFIVPVSKQEISVNFALTKNITD